MVRLTVEKTPRGERYNVLYNGSCEKCVNRNGAVMIFAFGLSTGCRLQEYSHSGRAYRWILEAWDEKKNRWKAYWDIIHYFDADLWFWKRPTVRCLQNRVIDLEGGGSTMGSV